MWGWSIVEACGWQVSGLSRREDTFNSTIERRFPARPMPFLDLLFFSSFQKPTLSFVGSKKSNALLTNLKSNHLQRATTKSVSNNNKEKSFGSSRTKISDSANPPATSGLQLFPLPESISLTRSTKQTRNHNKSKSNLAQHYRSATYLQHRNDDS